MMISMYVCMYEQYCMYVVSTTSTIYTNTDLYHLFACARVCVYMCVCMYVCVTYCTVTVLFCAVYPPSM